MRQTKKVVIACVGDSITEGIGACPMDTCSYPAVLQQLLGDGCTVKNFGASGMTLLREGDYPYCREPRYAASFAGAPDVVLLMMGTNDAKPQNWRFREAYSAELTEMIRRYQALPTRPQVFVSTCATVHRPLDGITDAVVSGELAERQRRAAAETGCVLLEVGQFTRRHPEWSCDGVHPNNEGYRQLAAFFAAALRQRIPALRGGGEQE